MFLALLRRSWLFFFLELEEVLTVDGNYKFMFAINNQFPAPTLVFHDQQVVTLTFHKLLQTSSFL